MKLNQLLAIESQAKKTSHELTTAAYQKLQKEALFSGQTRTYRPIEDDGEQLPSESTPAQESVPDLLNQVRASLSPVFDLTLQKDTANCLAAADVVVDGSVILSGVPVTHLLWLEKQLTDVHTVICALPTLPASENWTFSDAQNRYVSEPTETTRAKRNVRPLVKYEATKEHPAQVELVQEDKLAGYWRMVRQSGAIPRSRASELRAKIEKLIAAVKSAREAANLADVKRVTEADAIFGYLLS